jgi:hypothetical protein
MCHKPYGSSIMSMAHLDQMMAENIFIAFDYETAI